MLALDWIFGATLLLALQLDTLALPTTDTHLATTEHLQSDIIIEGQPPPPCINNICPDVAAGGIRAMVPMPAHNSTLNDTIPETKAGNTTGSITGKHNTSSHDAHVPISCSSSIDESESTTPPVRSAKVERLRAAYRIAGQPPPPCHNHICPMAQTFSSETVEDSSIDTHPVQPDRFRATYKITGANQTIPASCRNGKVRCLFSTNSTELSNQTYENSTTGDVISNSTEKHPTPACRAHHTGSHFPTTHQTAPITCGDGTKPPCGNYHLTKDPKHSSNHSSNGTAHFPGTHQTAPITCGDGTKPPCGKYYLTKDPKHSSNNSSNGTVNFPGTHQTAPITCGDGQGPPCGSDHSIEDAKYSSNHSSNGTAGHFPGTRQTAPITCGDGSKTPCGKSPYSSNFSSNGTAHRPKTQQTAPVHCGDGTLPPCEQN